MKISEYGRNENMGAYLTVMMKSVGLFLIFASSVAWMVLLFYAMPKTTDKDISTFQIPQDFDSLAKSVERLHSLKAVSPLYVLILVISIYVFEQSFCIPGSALMNILCGALYGVLYGTLLTCLLASVGASGCYLMSKYFARGIILSRWPSRMKKLQIMVSEQKHRLPLFLLSIRLFPMTPGWFINLASPLIGIPLHWFFITMFFGLAPYNYVCVQTGSVLSEVNSLDDVFTMRHMARLVLVAFIVLVPSCLKRSRGQTGTGPSASEPPAGDEHVA